jgi:hypothetical protein
MTVESATYIASLSPSLPPGPDDVSEGDDHLRLIKTVLQNTFPGTSAAFVDLPHTWSQSQTFAGSPAAIFSTAAVGGTPIELVSTDPAGTAGPLLSLYRNSASPAISDFLGGIEFWGKDAGGTKTLYASIVAQITDASAVSEDGALYFNLAVAGSVGPRMKFDSLGLYPTPGGQALGLPAFPWASMSLVATGAVLWPNSASIQHSVGAGQGRLTYNAVEGHYFNQALVIPTLNTSIYWGTPGTHASISGMVDRIRVTGLIESNVGLLLGGTDPFASNLYTQSILNQIVSGFGGVLTGDRILVKRGTTWGFAQLAAPGAGLTVVGV